MEFESLGKVEESSGKLRKTQQNRFEHVRTGALVVVTSSRKRHQNFVYSQEVLKGASQKPEDS